MGILPSGFKRFIIIAMLSQPRGTQTRGRCRSGEQIIRICIADFALGSIIVAQGMLTGLLYLQCEHLVHYKFLTFFILKNLH